MQTRTMVSRRRNINSSVSTGFGHALQSIKALSVFSKILNLLDDLKGKLADKFSGANYQFHHQRRNIDKKGIRPLILVVVAVVLLVVGGKAILSSKNTLVKGQKVAIKPPIKTIELNREFAFPIRGEGGVDTGMEIKYTLEKLELADEIIVKGQRATAVEGRVFLLLTLKLTNNENVGIEIDTRDYVRLKVNGSEEKLAADIHNDPVEVQPLSTKFTRIGFPIDDDISEVEILVGEIKGDKETIQLSL